MRLIKTSMLILFTLIGITTLTAQKVYVDLNVGYALPLGGQSTQNSTSTSSINHNLNTEYVTHSVEKVNLSMGKGINFGGALGYKFNKNISFEIGLNYLLSDDVSSNSESTDNVVSTGYLTSRYTATKTTWSSSMFQFAPTVVISPGFEKFNPYAKFGFVMGLGSFTRDYESSTNSTVNGVTTLSSNAQTYEFSGGLGLGFMGSLGSQYIVNENLAVFAEVSFMSFNYSPKKSVNTKYTRDGVDELPNRTTSQKETEYVKEYDYTSNSTGGASNPDEPGKGTKIHVPFSNVGLKLGVKYSF